MKLIKQAMTTPVVDALNDLNQDQVKNTAQIIAVQEKNRVLEHKLEKIGKQVKTNSRKISCFLNSI